jgi:hypothetical protein
MLVIQSEFSRYSPTLEDDYFFELEHRHLERVSEEPAFEGVAQVRDETPGAWARFYQALTWHFDLAWYP